MGVKIFIFIFEGLEIRKNKVLVIIKMLYKVFGRSDLIMKGKLFLFYYYFWGI